uniref:WAPL domain-containing protein n=1 Tax=Panagrolaimus sp. ES5 TaxID=591445 RepID=A0AC34GWS9_9BILA
MNPARPLPKIAPGQLPPPIAKDGKSLSIQTGSGFSSPLTSPKKPKLNIAGIEESDSEGSTDDEMIIVEDTPPAPVAVAVTKNLTPDSDVSLIIEEEKPANIQQGQKRNSNQRDEEDPFVFNESDSSNAAKAKRLRSEFSLLRHKQSNSKVKNELSAVKKSPQPKYRPTWNDNNDDEDADEEEEEMKSSSQELKSSNNTNQSASFTRQTSAPTLASRPKASNPSSFLDQRSLKRVSQAQACLKSGEQEDFTQDFDYFMTVMEKEGTTENTIFLSLQSMTKKAVKIEFRNFLRRRTALSRIFKVINSHLNSTRICAVGAVFIYFMARDRQCFIADDSFIPVIMPLLKTKPEVDDKAFDGAVKTLWPILEEWSKVTSELINKPVNIGMTKETFNVSYLTLEALALVCMHKHDKNLQNHLFNNGCLHWIIVKVEKLAKKLSKCKDSGDGAVGTIGELNRCMRILETSSVYNKNNQTYMMTGGNFALLQACTSVMQTFKKFVVNGDESIRIVTFDSMCTVLRVLLNMTHDNELCCTKLGDMNNFLEFCLNCITELSPKYAPKDKYFDIILLCCALLVNIAEKSPAIRSRLIEMNPRIYDSESKTIKEDNTITAFTQLFIRHESAARTVDEEFDKEFELDDIPEDDDETNAIADDGRLHRGEDMSESDALQAIQAAMTKADSQMEDSVMASYFGILLGCLIQRDTQNAMKVRDMMPSKNFTALIEQLNRFKEFMEMTHKKTTNSRTVERIVGALQGYNAL